MAQAPRRRRFRCGGTDHPLPPEPGPPQRAVALDRAPGAPAPRLVVDQPQKRPRSSWVRFEAALANECWQSDMTHWHLGEQKVEILHFIDDCSRAVLSSKVLRTATAPDTIELFYATAATWGLPASVLSDNGAIYTAAYRGAATGLEIDLAALGISFKHGKPNRLPRPRARSSATTRPSRSGSVPTMSSIPSTPSSAASNFSPATTTRSVPTKPMAARPSPSTRSGTRPHRASRARWSHRPPRFAGTGSTPTAP